MKYMISGSDKPTVYYWSCACAVPGHSHRWHGHVHRSTGCMEEYNLVEVQKLNDLQVMEVAHRMIIGAWVIVGSSGELLQRRVLEDE